ncbi:RluA family pseudouridine synthase [Fictibacillus gelatini]|uniref:RluA family pseudouridine synthase n=1 Tax=Fictibacillus gelatini TaxID=225985 RepID=UPI0003F5F66B|nr:RluA family pseudouridine synthase [Fictibacillus gelatini]
MTFKISWKVTEAESGMMLREFLRVHKKISKSALTDIKFSGGVLQVNGEDVTVRKVLAQGDFVEVIFPPEKVSEHMESEEMPLDILYEDDHLLIVNKPPGIPTIPSRYQNFGSLAQGVLSYYEKNGIQSTFHAVNRLDRDTSGIVIIAKHRFAHALLSEQQKNKTLKRTYIAVVHGLITEKTGVITGKIGRNPNSIVERMVREDGQEAITHYSVIDERDDKSTVTLQLETGRTHQIRVHMAYIGHPLIGDDLYGGTKEEIDRQALHSYQASFFHPFLEKEIEVTAPLPSDMRKLMSDDVAI